ncbi:unnamed protein product, partial [Pleuronectes platessa]
EKNNLLHGFDSPAEADFTFLPPKRRRPSLLFSARDKGSSLILSRTRAEPRPPSTSPVSASGHQSISATESGSNKPIGRYRAEWRGRVVTFEYVLEVDWTRSVHSTVRYGCGQPLVTSEGSGGADYAPEQGTLLPQHLFPERLYAAAHCSVCTAQDGSKAEIKFPYLHECAFA